MRAGLAQDTVARPRKALVLGNAALAARISQDLAAQGIEGETEARFSARTQTHLLSPANLEGVEGLRTYLTEAKRKIPGLLFVHPGASAWADRSELPVICQEIGLQAISPPARVMSLFGNKLNLLMEAEKAKVPHLVTSFDPIQSVREIEALMKGRSDTMRFPFVLKSVRGGGAGVGVRVIHSLQDMERTLPIWLDQLRSRFGEAILFPERYLEGAVYLIQPFARFADGTLEYFPAVDASLQYRYRKLVEFCPATTVDPKTDEKIKDWTKKLADQVSFVGVGAFEFLVEANHAYLIEGLARLNTGFHLWEKVAGTSAVSWQMATLTEESPRSFPPKMIDKHWTSSLSVRIHAEDPVLQIPQPGMIRELSSTRQWSNLTGVAEMDWSVQSGEEVASSSDGLLGLLWVGGRSRSAALQLAEEILSQIWISGSVHTNERFVLELIQHPWVKDGIYHAGFVDEEFIPLVRPSLDYLKLGISVSAQAAQTPATWTASGLKLEPDSSPLIWVEGPEHWIQNGLRGCSGRVKMPSGEEVRISAYPATKDRWQVRVGCWWVSVRRWEKGASPQIYSLSNGKVHSILFREGAQAPAHETILLIESLQILIPHAVPTDVRILRWKVKPGDAVLLGQALADLEKTQKGGG